MPDDALDAVLAIVAPCEYPADPKGVAARAALERAKAGELLGPHDLAAIWRISVSQFYRLNRAGEFDHLKTKPPIGSTCFSGVLVYRFVTGETVYQPTFGKKRAAR